MTMSSALRSKASSAARNAFFRGSMSSSFSTDEAVRRPPERHDNGQEAACLLFIAQDLEHGRAAGRAFALGCLAAVLHGLFLRIFHFSL
jgi:hypothetical protein